MTRTFADQDRLQELATAHRATYARGAPFPHVVLDDFLPEETADRLLREFPAPETFVSESSLAEPRRYGKRRSSREETFSPFTREVLHAFCDDAFLDFLSALTGTKDLISDHDRAGALRHFGRGGRLGVHADANFNAAIDAYRRVNLILYLNRDWQDAWRGQLELWDADLERCVTRIAPRFNRAILFGVGDRYFHGFPEALRCPRGTTRKSIQFYYYTRTPPDPIVQPHGTLFQWREGDRWRPERLWHAVYRRLRGRSRRRRRH